MSRLTFPMTTELRSIIAHARAAKKFRAPYGIGKPEPSLYFVKDSGIYLMSGADPSQARADGKPGRLVQYAKGFEPDAADSWDRCRDAVGGDDFVEALPLKFFTSALDNGATAIVLIVDEKNMKLEAVFPKPRRARDGSVRGQIRGNCCGCDTCPVLLTQIRRDVWRCEDCAAHGDKKDRKSH